MSNSDKTILVTAATGKQGGATARRLLAAGWRVRALVRDPAAPAARALAEAGAELALGDFDDAASVTGAVAGAHGVFAVPPATYGPRGWDIELEYRRGAVLVAAAVVAGVEHFVFTGIASFTGTAALPGYEGKHRIEDRIRASGVAYTLLRPVRFMENYLFRDAPIDGIHNGVHRHMFPPGRPMQIIAVDDVGYFAAAAFADPDRFAGRTLELAGDDPTPVEAAAVIGETLGSEIRYERMELSRAAALGEEIADTWKLLDAGSSWHADIPELKRLHPGLKSLRQWLAADGAKRIEDAIS